MVKEITIARNLLLLRQTTPEMNIKTLVISSFKGSGISDRAQIASMLKMHENGVYFHILLNENSPKQRFFEEEGIATTPYTIKSKIDKKAIQTIRDIVRTEKIDIIHCFNNNATTNAVQAAKKLNVKIISYRGFTGHVHWYKPSSLMNNLHPRVARIACVSNAVKNQVRSQLWRNKKKAVTIYKGHDKAWYEGIQPTSRDNLGVPDNAFLVGIVANLRPMKGIKYLISAAKHLNGHYDIHFLLIGRGMDSDKIKELINETPLKDNFHTFGFRKDVLKDVAACDIAVNSSIKGEGLSKTIIEAMSLKKPVVATTAGGNPELIIDHETGLSVPIKDPEAIADAILEFKHSGELRQKMAMAGYQYIINHFTVEQTAQQTMDLYKELKTELETSKKVI
ncbi:glycosyltransferase family 4 protein [Salinivirga cyanobacteriivorans]